MGVLIVASACLGRLARAHKALAVARLTIRRRSRVFVNADTMARAVGCSSLATSGGGEAAEVDGRGGRVFDEAAEGGGGGDVGRTRAWGNYNFGLGNGQD